MKFIATEIPGVKIIEPRVWGDARGFFYESYRRDVFRDNGIDVEFIQDNHSLSQKGVLRGLHFQKGDSAQAKLVRVVRGAVFDVAVDIRKGSATFGKYVAETLSAENRRMMYVPEGFAHGFCVLEDNSEFLYKVSRFYAPGKEGGIIWNDPDIGIPWPETGVELILSEKDQHYPRLKDL